MANNYTYKQCSCYFLDIRNSTTITRTISLKSQRSGNSPSANTAGIEKLLMHSQFMVDVHRYLFEKLQRLSINDYYFNNTGDGHVCLLWSKTHAWTILNIACSISNFLEKKINDYRQQYLQSWEKEYQKELSIGFGIGMHTGSAVLMEENISHLRFAYGIVLNTAARTESFTKNFPTLNLLFTKHFKLMLKNQFPFLESPMKSKWATFEKLITPVTEFAVDTKDGKQQGHLLFTIHKSHRRFFIDG